VSHRFLSPEWFTEVARIRAELGDLQLPASVRELVIDVEVSDAPEGTIQAHVLEGTLVPGFAEHAELKLRLPYRVAHELFVSRDPAAGLRAYMSGQLQVQGNVMQLMNLHQAGETPESRRLLDRISAITA
jgi:hypothetical protein